MVPKIRREKYSFVPDLISLSTDWPIEASPGNRRNMPLFCI